MLPSVFQRSPCASVDVCRAQSAHHYISSSVIRRGYIVIPPRDPYTTLVTLKVILYIVLFDELQSVLCVFIYLFNLVLVQLK